MRIGKKNVAGKGHWHISVNGKLNNASGSDHSSLSEPTRSKAITVTVDKEVVG